jgi:CubicO group peptidase (beta-lactamase class C family)
VLHSSTSIESPVGRTSDARLRSAARRCAAYPSGGAIPATVLKRVISAGIVLSLLLVSGWPAQAQESLDERTEQIRALFSDLAERGSPGLAIAVVRDGKVLLSEGYGLANLEHRVPITSSTVFDVASLSKQLTGLAVAILVEQGKLGLDDAVRDHIPELADFGGTITVRHLLHHTSGLRDWPGTLTIAGWSMHDVISYPQILRMAYNQRTLNFAPGSEYAYSNTGYVLLAELVARVTGMSFRGWMDEHVFRPLGMMDTHVHDDHTEVVPNRAYGYASSPAGDHRLSPNNLTAIGSSSVYSTADDWAKWLINLDRRVVGGRSALESMLARGVLNDGSTIPYAFGLSHGEHRGAATLSHSGGWASFQTYSVHLPEQRFGVVVLANSTGVNPDRTAYQIADIYLEGELAPQESNSPLVRVPVEVVPTLLDRFAGVYRLEPGRYVRIRRDGAGLVTRATLEAEFPMLPVSETEFWVEAYDTSIVFEQEPDGSVRHLLFRGRRLPKMDDSRSFDPGAQADLVGEYVSEELQTSYSIGLEDGVLVMRHRRHGTIPLTLVWHDEFLTTTSFRASVEFLRDEAGSVVAMVVNLGERNRDLRFEKREP